jgi:hypothetical protein
MASPLGLQGVIAGQLIEIDRLRAEAESLRQEFHFHQEACAGLLDQNRRLRAELSDVREKLAQTTQRRPEPGVAARALELAAAVLSVPVTAPGDVPRALPTLRSPNEKGWLLCGRGSLLGELIRFSYKLPLGPVRQTHRFPSGAFRRLVECIQKSRRFELG